MLLLSLLLAVALPSPQVAFVRSGTLRVVDVDAKIERPILEHVPSSPVGISGNGEALSAGGRVPGIPPLSTSALVWAPEGETAAYQTRDGAVWTWTPSRRRRILPASWGATSLAWGPGGRLALGRSVCRVPCGVPEHQEVWVWRAGELKRVAGPLRGVQRPLVRGFDRRERVLWWSDLEGSASIAADGLPLYADGTRLTTTLPYTDSVADCGAGLVVSAGTDRYAMHGKRLLLDGHDLSRDPSRSWIAPSCRGATIVAAASRNAVPRRIGDEHRAIWQLRPVRRQLTHPPAHASDEDPRVLADGSIAFVRTRSYTSRLNLFGLGTLMLLRSGRLTRLADAGSTTNYYGHYGWMRQLAVWP